MRRGCIDCTLCTVHCKRCMLSVCKHFPRDVSRLFSPFSHHRIISLVFHRNLGALFLRLCFSFDKNINSNFIKWNKNNVSAMVLHTTNYTISNKILRWCGMRPSRTISQSFSLGGVCVCVLMKCFELIIMIIMSIWRLRFANETEF